MYFDAMPMYWPVLGSRMAPLSGSTVPPVSGSIRVPSDSVINPVLAFTVALAVDVALAVLEEDPALLALLELLLEELLELLPEELEVLAVDSTNGCAALNLAHTLEAELAHTTRFESEGAVVTGTV